MEGTVPYLKFRTFSGIIILIGHAAFAINFVWLLARCFGPYRQPASMILAGTRQETLGATP
jgi:cytochrome c oxidase cbb3-type subunit 1